MKSIIFVLLVSLAAAGCGLVNSKATATDNLTASFTLQGPTGQTDTTFQSGQQFIMSFSLTNSTGHPITDLSSSIPAVHFQIWKNDSLIGMSVYAMSNAFVSIPDTLAPGATLQEQCQAPTSLRAAAPAQGNLSLPAGQYEAMVVYPGFTGAQVNCASSLVFTVTQ